MGRTWAQKRGLRMTLAMVEAARERYGEEGIGEYVLGAIEMNRASASHLPLADESVQGVLL